MAINFPSSPTEGQSFTSGKVIYTYASATGTWQPTPLGTALPYNYVVNPSFEVSQQNGDMSGLRRLYFAESVGPVVAAPPNPQPVPAGITRNQR